MRRGAWSVVVAFLCLPSLAGADSAMTPVRGDIDHRLDALLEGQVSTGATSVLASLAPENQVPVVRTFHLEAPRAEATIVRTSTTVSIVQNPVDLLAADAGAIEQNHEEVEQRVYHDLSVLPIQTSDLWNVVAFGQPGSSFQVLLPEGAYRLGQAPDQPSVVRPEVPRTSAMSKALAPATQGAASALEVRSDGLHVTYRGDFVILLYGASFRFVTPDGSEDVDTGRYHAQYAVKGGYLPEQRRVNASAFVRVHDGVLELDAGDAPLALYARELQLHGRATFEDPTGTLDWQGRAETADAATRTLEGDLRILPRGPAYTRADGQRFGPLQIEGYALAAVAAGPSAWPLVVAASAGAAGLAAAFRWLPGVRRLLWAAVAGFSLVEKNEALEHKARAQLYDFVRSNPGATLSGAQEHVGLGWGTVEYHVAVLERLGLLVTKRAGGKRLLFVTGQGRIVDPAAWSLLRNPSVRQLASTVLAPGRAATQVEVAQALDCSPQYAGRLIRKLVEAGLVAPHAESDRRAFAPTDLFHDLARRSGLVAAPAQDARPLETPLTA
jgi:DNA-binding transcriptional ArsR family regulator